MLAYDVISLLEFQCGLSNNNYTSVMSEWNTGVADIC